MLATSIINVHVYMSRKVRLIVSWALVLGVAATLSGCNSQPASGYQDRFKEAAAASSSDYVKQVFQRAVKEGQISAADYRDSRSQLENCYRQAGYTPEKENDSYGLGIVDIFPGGNASDPTAAQKCEEQWDGQGDLTITELFRNQVVNPQNEDMDKLVAACLVRKDLVAKDFSAGDYREWNKQNMFNCRGNVCTNQATGETVNLGNGGQIPSSKLILPGGKSIDTPEGQQCLYAPLLDTDQK